LKPGGKFGFNDVAALDKYDRENHAHRLLIQHTRELTVFGGFWHYEYWEDAFKNAGFELLESHGQPAVECIKKEVALYDKYEAVTSFLAAIRVFPRRFFKLMRRLHANAESYINCDMPFRSMLRIGHERPLVSLPRDCQDELVTMAKKGA
jgi:sterol 24-C-methyltransferase